jgi:hypothetical protein
MTIWTPRLMLASVLAVVSAAALANPALWKHEWPRTDFTRHAVPLDEIHSGGPPKDGIPAIDRPSFAPISAAGLADREPVLGLVLEGEARAYPLRVMIWHEIVNDRVGGVPVAVTYCPLCNAAIAFDRRLDGRELDFGTTGKLRHSDLVMYDRQTESWWQQFSGEAIVGELAGARLRALPVRLESFAAFKARAPQGVVLVPNDPASRRYGHNPYVGYESSGWPFLFRGEVPEGVLPLERVVTVGDEAWSLPLLRREREVRSGDLRIAWREGQASALEAAEIAEGPDVGDVIVQRAGVDVTHHVTFAFVFFAFHPDGVLHDVGGRRITAR